MEFAFNQQDLDDLKPYVDKAVQRFVGLSEPTVVNAAISLLGSGADKHQFTNKLRTLHPSLNERAHKLTDLIFELVAEYFHSVQQHQQKAAKKRNREEEMEVKAAKVIKTEVDEEVIIPSPGQLTTMQIKQMMANAQRMIEERKKALEVMSGGQMPPVRVLPTMPTLATEPKITAAVFDGIDKKRKLAELQAQIQSKLAAGAVALKIKEEEDEEASTKPIPLLLDNEGRAIDVSGKQLLFPTRVPTLKANIRAQKKVEAKQQVRDKAFQEEEEEELDSKYFDDRLGTTSVKKGVDRKKKSLKFNEPGKYVALAHKQRMQAQLSRLQMEIADKARKTGISTAARLAKLSGASASSDKSAEYIPQVEWWDALILEEKEIESKEMLTYDCPIKVGTITNLIEHPSQLRCPTDPLEQVYMPVFLTKKERKKLRRQNRRENWKDTQEKIRLGLEPAPAPKVRISNLMRVLGVEAVQDPTKVEAHVRKEMAKRLKSHLDANLSRKLTPEQRKAKKQRKMEENVTLGVHVSVYRINCLANQSKRFKVDTVARQLQMTGCVIMSRECNIVVVEGGPKQQSKYRRLMLTRIKWDEDMVKDKEDCQNKCVLVWEGMVKERNFSDLKFKMVKTEELVREYFKKHGVQHYWDAALSGTVLESVLESM